jgi:hypothetical protein
MSPTSNTISSTEQPAAPATTQPAASPAPAPDAATQAELASLRDRLAEKERQAEFWHGHATAQRERAAPEPEPAPEPEEEEDILDVLTTKGTKGLDAILAKRGYVKADQMRQYVGNTAGQSMAELELKQQYPDLGDNKSEFFQQTAVHYGELVNQGVPQATAMRLAARLTEADGVRSGKIKTAAQTAADKEATRIARIKAQGGDRSSRAAESGEEGDDELTAREKHICEAMGISEDAYKARAQKGVQFAIRGRR